MPIVEASIVIHAPTAALFALAQDYTLRLAWDPFLREMKFLDGASEAAVGVRVRVRAKNGLSMEVEYTTLEAPERVAMVMVRGPFFFEQFAGTWRFRNETVDQTTVYFRYSFKTRWGWLRLVLDRIIQRIFLHDIRGRLHGLKQAAETTDILERLASRSPSSP